MIAQRAPHGPRNGQWTIANLKHAAATLAELASEELYDRFNGSRESERTDLRVIRSYLEVASLAYDVAAKMASE